MDPKIKLECIEENCRYVTQELPFHQAQRLLNMHLNHTHPQELYFMQQDVPQPEPQRVAQQPAVVQQQAVAQQQVFAQQQAVAQQQVVEYFLLLRGLPISMTSAIIER